MGWRDDYRARVNAYGGNIAGSYLGSTKSFINSSFANSPSYRLGKLNGTDIDFLFESGDNKKDQFGEKIFIFRPDTVVYRGDIIQIDSDNFIAFDINDRTSISPRVTGILCDTVLNWKDASGTTYSYPCVTVPYRSVRTIQSDSYTLNLAEGHMFAVVQMNTDTQTIALKQRFILGNQVYEISGIDDSNYAYNGKGIIYFTVTVSTKDSRFNDDWVNRIADNSFLYESQIPSPTSVTGTVNTSTSPASNGGKVLW